MKFSLVVAYRDRDRERVRRCLESLDHQTYTDFEIVFVDYGSGPVARQQTFELVGKLSRTRYVYLHTRGWLWCKAHALNRALTLVQGEYIVIIDIDVIYPPEFLDYLAGRVTPESFIQYRCYYLPENFSRYDTLRFDKKYPCKVSVGTGLLVAPKKAIDSLGGYDEYFKIWGFEDMDMHSRLLRAGGQVQWLSIDELTTFHQWHLSMLEGAVMPRSWVDTMKRHWKTKTSTLNTRESLDTLHDLDRRPALIVASQLPMSPDFVFDYPFIESLFRFIDAFYALPSHGTIVVNQFFELIDTRSPSGLAAFFKRFNQWLEKLGISYRVTELVPFETEVLNFISVRNFLLYFLHRYELMIEDYYLSEEGQERIVFVVVKK